MFLLARCKSSELLLKHLTGKGAINHSIPDFCCLGHYKNQGNVFNEHSSCSKHFTSSALILFQNCFLKALQHMALRKKKKEKKVVGLVLTHLFSTDKQKFAEIIPNKIHMEYTFIKTFLLNPNFKESCCITGLNRLFQRY